MEESCQPFIHLNRTVFVLEELVESDLTIDLALIRTIFASLPAVNGSSMVLFTRFIIRYR